MAGKSILKGGAKGAAKATKRTPNYVPVNFNPTARAGSQIPITMGPTRGSTRVPMPKRKYGPAMPQYGPPVPGPQYGPPVPGPQYGPLPPPPKQPGFFAKHGKKTAAAVAGGLMVGGSIKNRTGKAVDPTTGLPKGMYGY